MRFYRPLGRISALTFDLDDTLYDNSDVIRLAEERFLQMCAKTLTTDQSYLRILAKI